MYQAMKVDLRRHETLCYEIATKFETHHNLLKDLTDHVETLKTYTLVNDLHMEAYQPLQIATIAFEVCKSSVTKK